MKLYLIREGQHYLYWREKRQGYTADIAEAGVYSQLEAESIVNMRRDPPDTMQELKTFEEEICRAMKTLGHRAVGLAALLEKLHGA